MQPTQQPVPDDSVTAQRLRQAALYLLRHGWQQGDMFADPGQPTPAACALGAIRMAVYGTPAVSDVYCDEQRCEAFDRAVGVFADFLVEYYGVEPIAAEEYVETGSPEADLVIEWNDRSDRIASHVIAAFYGAADEWDRLHPTELVGGGA